MKTKKYNQKEIDKAVKKAEQQIKDDLTIDKLKWEYPKSKYETQAGVDHWFPSDMEYYNNDEVTIDSLITALNVKKAEGATHVSFSVGHRSVQIDFLTRAVFTDEMWVQTLTRIQSDKAYAAGNAIRTEMEAHNKKIDLYLQLKAEFE